MEQRSNFHLQIRMGWSPAMDIEGTELLFRARVREAVVIWGMVTPLRVTSIEYSIDPDHSAFYLIFTVLDTPPSEDIELNDMENAVRPNAEVSIDCRTYADHIIFINTDNDQVLSNIKGAVDKGWFKVWHHCSALTSLTPNLCHNYIPPLYELSRSPSQ